MENGLEHRLVNNLTSKFDQLVNPIKELNETNDYYKVKTFNAFCLFAFFASLINFLIRFIQDFILKISSNYILSFDSFSLVVLTFIFFLLGKSRFYNFALLIFPLAPLGVIWIYFAPLKLDFSLELFIINPTSILVLGLVAGGLIYSIREIIIFLIATLVDIVLFYGLLSDFSFQILIPRFLLLILIGIFMIIFIYFRINSFRLLTESKVRLTEDVVVKRNSLIDERFILYSLIANLKEGVLIIDDVDTPIIVNNNFTTVYKNITQKEFNINSKLDYKNNKHDKINQFLLKLINIQEQISELVEIDRKFYLFIGHYLKSAHNSKLLGLMIEVQDITDLKMVEVLEKNFRTTIMHELRTPTTSLQLSISNLTKYWDKLREEEKLKLIQAIERQSNIFTHLIKEVSTLTDLENINKIEYSHVTIKSFITEFENEFVKNSDIPLQVELNIATFNRIININIKLIFKALSNILENAKKFSDKDSKINIEFYLKDNKFFCIKIMDQGIGIDKSDLPFIFNKFFKGKNAENIPGEGLGLSVSQEIIFLHNGNILIESKINEGTVVEIILPLA